MMNGKDCTTTVAYAVACAITDVKDWWSKIDQSCNPTTTPIELEIEKLIVDSATGRSCTTNGRVGKMHFAPIGINRGNGGSQTWVIKGFLAADPQLPDTTPITVTVEDDPNTGASHDEIDNNGLHREDYVELVMNIAAGYGQVYLYDNGAYAVLMAGLEDPCLNVDDGPVPPRYCRKRITT